MVPAELPVDTGGKRRRRPDLDVTETPGHADGRRVGLPAAVSWYLASISRSTPVRRRPRRSRRWSRGRGTSPCRRCRSRACAARTSRSGRGRPRAGEDPVIVLEEPHAPGLADDVRVDLELDLDPAVLGRELQLPVARAGAGCRGGSRRGRPRSRARRRRPSAPWPPATAAVSSCRSCASPFVSVLGGPVSRSRDTSIASRGRGHNGTTVPGPSAQVAQARPRRIRRRDVHAAGP